MSTMTTRLYHGCLGLYRKTIKRMPRIHALAYGVVDYALRLVSGATGFATRSSDPLFWRLALMTGSHEAGTRALFGRIIRPGMTVVDIGAHIGYYTCQFSRLVGPDGGVVSFEPHPRNYELLERNTRGRRNVTLVRKAAAERPQNVTLAMSSSTHVAMSSGYCSQGQG